MVPDERCWNWSPLTYNMDRSPTSFATPCSQWYAFLGEHILRADRHATQPKRELLLLHWTESVFHCHVNSYLLAIGRNHWKQLIKAKLAAIEFWKHFAGWSHEPERTGICWVFKKHLLQKFTRIFCIIFSFLIGLLNMSVWIGGSRLKPKMLHDWAKFDLFDFSPLD